MESDYVELVMLTLRVAVVATLMALPPALAVGYGLARFHFRGRVLVESVIALPMVLPPVAVGLFLLVLLGPNGPLGSIFDALGIRIVFTWWAAALAAASVGFPLLVRSCQQSFSELNPNYEKLARTLGQGRLRVFFAVTLPLAKRGVVYGSLLCFTRALGEFGATALVAGIIPGRTETLALGIWSRVQWGDDDAALVLGSMSFALALASMLVAESWFRRGES